MNKKTSILSAVQSLEITINPFRSIRSIQQQGEKNNNHDSSIIKVSRD